MPGSVRRLRRPFTRMETNRMMHKLTRRRAIATGAASLTALAVIMPGEQFTAALVNPNWSEPVLPIKLPTAALEDLARLGRHFDERNPRWQRYALKTFALLADFAAEDAADPEPEA
jgi:hypothetical protein